MFIIFHFCNQVPGFILLSTTSVYFSCYCTNKKRRETSVLPHLSTTESPTRNLFWTSFEPPRTQGLLSWCQTAMMQLGHLLERPLTAKLHRQVFFQTWVEAIYAFATPQRDRIWIGYRVVITLLLIIIVSMSDMLLAVVKWAREGNK